MTIINSDIKLYESEELIDQPYGGGKSTGIEVIDGQVNNLFQDISRLDRTIGDVSLRKVFVGVDTGNNDTYLGTHAIVKEVPADPNVRVVLFNTGSQSDVRGDAINYIENYLVKGSKAIWELLGNQVAGQRTIIGVQRMEHDLPEVGQVFVLSYDNDEQYVRIISIESSEEIFPYPQGNGSYTDLIRRKLILTMNSPLTVSYPGGSVTPSGTTSPKSGVFTTQVVDAAKYYGATRLADSATAGDVTVVVNSIFENIVPVAQTENAIIDEPAGYAKNPLFAGSQSTISDAYGAGTISPSSALAMHLRRSPLPGSLTVSTPLGQLTETGDGVLSGANGIGGTVDYENGLVVITSVTSSSTNSNVATATYIPAAQLTFPSETGSVQITQQTRGYVYTLSFSGAAPAPGTFALAFLALGKWQQLNDRGDGVLEGEGTGTIDFGTGSVNITLSGLPDVNTEIIYSFATKVDDENLIDTATLTVDGVLAVELVE